MAKQSLYFRFGLRLCDNKFFFLGEDYFRDVALNNCRRDQEELDLSSFLIIDLWDNRQVDKLNKWLEKNQVSTSARATIMKEFANFLNGVIDESERSSQR